MQLTETTVGPLSPFLWSVPQRRVSTPGSLPGKVGDLRQFIADLTVNFELLVREFAPPYEHPVYNVFQQHPVHTSALSKRQFDVLRYGMVLDGDERLVIMEAPQECADAGARVAREYNAIFHTHLDHTEISGHPLLPEYSLLVMRLPKAEEEAQGREVPELLFRLVFRNEAYNGANLPSAEMAARVPLFRLRSVLVPSACYEAMNEIHRYRACHSDVLTTPAGKELPDPTLEQSLQSPPIRDLCDAWVLVVHGMVPQWVCDKGLGPDVPSLLLTAHHHTDAASILPSSCGPHRTQEEQSPKEDDERTCLLDNCVRLNYTQNRQRMQHRIRVIKREPGIITRWRDGELDIPVFETEVVDAKGVVTPLADPRVGRAGCARLLLRPTRGGVNTMDEGEICAYVPEEYEHAEQHVYRTKAAEKLRLWVAKGLVTAELHQVHAVLMEVDPLQLLSQCVGLLHGEDEDRAEGVIAARHNESIFHVCKILVETVEDYVQHSGVVWQVTLAILEDNGSGSKGGVALCKEILALTQLSKARVEEQEKERFDRKEDGSAAECVQQRDTADQLATGLLVATRADNGALAVQEDKQVTAAAIFYNEKSSIAAHVAESASTIGCEVRDSCLFPVFTSLCKAGEDTVPVKSVVRILLDKLEGGQQRNGRHASLFWPMENPLLNLDNCGIPCNQRSVFNFVMGFCPKPYRSRNASATHEEEPSLNYVGFSMMMLALAYQ